MAHVFKGYDVVALSPACMVDCYHTWFKRYGLYDFLEDLVSEDDLICDVQIIGGAGTMLSAHNLHQVIALI